MSKYHVLSLDGGGIRGIITVILLQRLSREPGLEHFLEQVDLVAGTSTGGLIALALADNMDLEVIRQLYIDKGPEIFDDSWLDDVVDLGTLIGAEYHNTNLTREIRKVFKTKTLGDLPRHVIITTFDLDNEDPDPKKRTWKPKMFHNIKGQGNDNAALAYKVGLYTAAAPTYFPAVDGYIDGGVFAGNPSMIALAQTQDRRNAFRPPLSDVVLFSVGTGHPLTYIKGKTLNWGYAQWVKPLISLMLDGVTGVADYQCKQMLGDAYCRLDLTFPPNVSIPMDDIKKIPDMIQYAQQVPLASTVAWLKQNWL